MIIENDLFLEHFGKKGMKWGQRKARRLADKQARQAAYQKKAEHIVNTALKDPNVLINLGPHAGNLIVTGKEFVDHMAAGGLMDAKRISIYAQQKNKTGPYVLQ